MSQTYPSRIEDRLYFEIAERPTGGAQCEGAKCNTGARALVMSAAACTPGCHAAPLSPRLALLLTILVLHAMTGGASALGHGGGANCRVEVCSRRHDAVVQQRVDEVALCQGIFSYLTCLRENARSCRGNLKYHTTLRGLTRLVDEYDCVRIVTAIPPSSVEPYQEGHKPTEFPGRPETTTTTTSAPVEECTYRGPHTQEMRHCGLFGDPHLKTFNGELQTCRVRGAWPLMDSPYFAVQVTNEPVRPGSHATVTTKVTVIVKGGHSLCTTEKVYEAQAEYLPETFLDGTTTSGSRSSHSVSLHVIEPNTRIEIRVRHLAAKLLLRRVAGALSFSAQMPLEIALPPGRELLQGSLELCSRGCPASERLGHAAAVAQPAALQREAALAVCRSRNLSSTYLEWCVFDVMTTGDKHFAEAAFAAQADVISLDPSADAVLSADTKWLNSAAVHPQVSLLLVLAVVLRTFCGS